MAENSKNKELANDPQVTMKDLMDLVESFGYAMNKITELTNSIYDAMANMNERIEDISEGVSALQMDVESLSCDVDSIDIEVGSLISDVGTIDSNITSLASDISSVDSQIASLDSNMYEIKLNTEYLEKAHDNIENNLMNVAIACEAKYEIDTHESSLLEDEDEEYEGVDDKEDNQKKDNRCVMCAGTGFIEALTECDELQSEAEGSLDHQITCPYCEGSGIEDK